MINLYLINHSSCTVERFYSSVNLMKNPIRNLLDVESVSTLLQVKSYYKEDFRITQKHHEYYQNFIKHKFCVSFHQVVCSHYYDPYTQISLIKIVNL